MVQVHFDFETVHQRENNWYSEAHLLQHRDKFNLQCWNLLMGMLQGTRYSTTGYNVSHHISSLPRRAKDLIDGYGFPIKREWAHDPQGNRLDHKEYYIHPDDYTQCYQIIVNHLETKKAS